MTNKRWLVGRLVGRRWLVVLVDGVVGGIGGWWLVRIITRRWLVVVGCRLLVVVVCW